MAADADLDPAVPGAEPDPGGRFGAPVELPWWAPVAMLPPVGALLGGILLGAPVEARITDIVVSALMTYAVVAVSTRVESRNMQSVYLSAAYAFWFFLTLIWLVTALPPHLLR